LRAASGKRALVCIYLFGGSDSNNLIVPLSSYDAYASLRGHLAIPQASLIPVTSGLDQAQYGFHPALSEVASLFQQRSLAVVSNVGSESPALLPDPYLGYFPPGRATPGWAAEIAGVTSLDVRNLFAQFPNLSSTGGRTTQMSLIAPGVSATDSLREAVTAEAKAAGGQWSVPFPDTGLGQQLRQVAALIRSAGTLGMERQVFLVGLSAFAFPLNDLAGQANMFRELSSGMAAFFSATREMGMAQDVTTYTDTEFSRSLRPNPQGGLDPAWGGHQLVMGGSVLGGSVFGQFPAPSVGGAHDPKQRGILRPSSSKDQYYATLANWYGVPPYQAAKYLPRIQNGGRPTLGFMVTG
jgi:uncharacterized protein (DUF1501 family)